MKRSVLLLAIFCAGAAAGHAADLVWTYEPPAGYVDASPALGDLNGDGKQDIVIGTTAGVIVALTVEAGELWRQEMRGPISVSPSIGDVNGNGAPEVLVLNRQGDIRCFAGRTGDLLWAAALPGRLYWGETTLALADVTGDGRLEIISGDRDGAVICLNGAGETLWIYRGEHGVTLAPVIADLTDDGAMEILVGGDKIPLVCLSAQGEELWRSESGIGGSPLVYDITGDGAPEILVAVNERFTVRDAAGTTLWTYVMQREMDSALTVADADENGEVEIYVVDLAGNLTCLSPTGQVRWSASVEERARRSPTVGDVDGDGALEILVAGYSGALHVFAPDGRLKARVPVPGGVNSSATLVPLADGAPGVLLSVSNEALRLLRWPDAQPGAALPWPEYRFDATRSGNPQAAAVAPPVELELDVGNMYVGANLLQAVVHNPEGRLIEVRLETTRNDGAPSVASVTSSDTLIEQQLSYTVPSNQALNLTLSGVTLEDGRVLTRRSHTGYLTPFMQELGDASRALEETESLLPLLLDRAGLEERFHFLKAQLERLQPRILTAGALTETERIDLRNTLHPLLNDLTALRDRARAAQEAATGGSVVLVAAANPWAPFGGMDEITEGRLNDAALVVEAFGGETESAALNIFNLSNTPRAFRVALNTLTDGDATVPARDSITLHEVVEVPTEMRDFSADAIPLLNSGNLIQVPAWGARQLWLNINTAALAPGTWAGQVQLRSLDIEPVTAEAGISLTVWPSRLPDEQAISLCHWGYVHTSMLKDWPEEALADQVRNGTNVFIGLFPPRAEYNEQGELIGEIDFSDHDAYVKRHAPHGMILFFNYQRALKGPGGMESDAYAKAHITWLRAWVARLEALGVGYDGFALYPVDEPGLSDGLVEHHILMAQLAREADPDILMYTDPVGRITEDELRRMLPYVDIWCPNRDGLILDKTNAAKLDIIKNAGTTVWMYECAGNVKHQSPLGYYRAQAWLAWHHDMTGIGFWSYCTSQDDPWFRPGLRHDYLMVYPGRGVVSSKRWEAVRDGVEDYTMLARLQHLLDNPPATAAPEDLAAAQTLLDEGAYAIAVFCGVDDDDTLPGTDGMPGVRRVTDARWNRIQETRRNLAQLLARLEGVSQ